MQMITARDRSHASRDRPPGSRQRPEPPPCPSSRRADVDDLYALPELYDLIVGPGPCEAFYRDEVGRIGGPVLELACGTGRLTLPLARDWHDVTGLDLSPEMLAVARRKAEAEGIAIRFEQGSMENFDLGRRFRAMIISCNSLAHLTTNDALLRCLTCVRRHLAAGGLLLFDVVRPDLGRLLADERGWRRLDEEPNPASRIAAEEEATYDPIAQVRTSRWFLCQPGFPTRELAPFALRQFFPQEIPLLLRSAGLDLVARYGDFARNPLTVHGLNQVCLAQAR